jgi:hypothetical protein
MAPLTIRLNLTPLQSEQLGKLQLRFSEACNSLAEIVAQTRCWNRVALHHHAYKHLREKFSDLGSQMTCNVIYSVCKSAKLVYQHPRSPYHYEKFKSKTLPKLQFPQTVPVFFDRHTLSVKSDAISIFTLDGRLKLKIKISPDLEKKFSNLKIKEILLNKDQAGFFMQFFFSDENSKNERTQSMNSATLPAQQESENVDV